MQHRKYYISVLLILVLLSVSSCYDKHNKLMGNDGVYLQQQNLSQSDNQIDTLSFVKTHHYGHNFNFVVKTDSLFLIRQLPEETLSNLPIDSFSVKKNSLLVVSDIRMLPNDGEDSIWVQLASDQLSIGWIKECNLLPNVDPDDPISQFISIFSNTHLLIFLIIFSAISIIYGMRILLKKNAHIVHFNDINSFYPTMLTLVVASSATFYATIQHFAPDAWVHFYFHPTLNPFSQPPLLALFLCTVWLMLITAIAAVDDVFRHLPFSESVLYLLSLIAVCAADYIIFSITTLYFVGYVLLIVYYIYALIRYFLHNRTHYICGNCAQRIRRKGICPYCGAMNF